MLKEKDLLTLEELKKELKNQSNGLIFCFGSSFISRVIQSKTRLYKDEAVPSHVAMLVNNKFLYESTSQPEHVGDKTIPAGVRRYLLEDFLKSEKKKLTKYYFIPIGIISGEAEKYIHLPYGKDIILDFLLRDGSDGDSKGLICSQYANLCTRVVDESCPSPAVLLRKLVNNCNENNLDDVNF